MTDSREPDGGHNYKLYIFIRFVCVRAPTLGIRRAYNAARAGEYRCVRVRLLPLVFAHLIAYISLARALG